MSSVLFDFRFPPRDAALRAELEADLERDGPGVLYERLRLAHAPTAERIDPRNGRRIVRALEVLAQGEATHGAALPDEPVRWRASTIIGLTSPREELVARLDGRVERMWAQGLLDEVEALRARGLERGVTARRAIGYAQALGQLNGTATQAEAIAETQALTRRYARRQVSWFTRYPDVAWSHSDGSQSGEDVVLAADTGLMTTIRAFTLRDTESVIALWQATGVTRSWNNPHLDIQRKLTVQPELFFVAVDGHDIVGTVMAGYDGHRGWLYYLASDPMRRGQGIGRALVTAAEDALLEMGCPKVQLMVRPDNDGVLGFYDTLGYERFDTSTTGKRLIAD